MDKSKMGAKLAALEPKKILSIIDKFKIKQQQANLSNEGPMGRMVVNGEDWMFYNDGFSFMLIASDNAIQLQGDLN